MGHVFGIDDGYPDKPSFVKDLALKSIGITHPTYRPDAYDLGILDEDDVMRYQFDRLNISNTDIAMMILAYSQDEFQSFADYTGHKKSEYFSQGGKE